MSLFDSISDDTFGRFFWGGLGDITRLLEEDMDSPCIIHGSFLGMLTVTTRHESSFLTN